MSGFFKSGSVGPVGPTGPIGPAGQAGESGIRYYLYDGHSDIVGYDIISKNPEYQGQEDDYAICVGGGGGSWGAPVLIASYITNSGDPGIKLIPAGSYVFNFWGYVSSSSQDSRLVFSVLIRNKQGEESLLFTCNSEYIDSTNILLPTILAHTYTTITTTYINSSDRLVLKIYAQTNSNSAKTVHFLHSDNNFASNFLCPFSNISEINWKTRYNIDFSVIGLSDPFNFKTSGDGDYSIDGHQWSISETSTCTSAALNSSGIDCLIPSNGSFTMFCNIGDQFSIDWVEQNIEIEFLLEIVSGSSSDQKIYSGMCFDIADKNNSSVFAVKRGDNINYGSFLSNQQENISTLKSVEDNALSVQIWSGGYLWNCFCSSQTSVWLDAGERKRLGSYTNGMMNNILGKDIYAYIQFLNQSQILTEFKIKQMRIRVR